MPYPKTSHCKHGHEWTEANTYVTSRGGRMCKECVRARKKQYRAEGRIVHRLYGKWADPEYRRNYNQQRRSSDDFKVKRNHQRRERYSNDTAYRQVQIDRAKRTYERDPSKALNVARRAKDEMRGPYVVRLLTRNFGGQLLASALQETEHSELLELKRATLKLKRLIQCQSPRN